MQPETLAAISAMLTGLGFPPGTDPDMLIRTYAIAIQGIREDAIRDACRGFIRGEVADTRRGRAPTTDIFARECRARAARLTAGENRSRALPKPPAPVMHTPESRARLKARFAALRRALAGDSKAQQQLQPYGWRP